MCKTTKNIRLCTCLVDGNIKTVIHHKNARRQKKDRLLDSNNAYKWTLYKYVGLQELTIDGMLLPPSDKLGEYLTNETILSELKNETCFDFEYQPNDGDNLLIYCESKSVYSFLSFIFRANQWEADTYDSFTHKTERINYGKVVAE
jgi:hypothetical protein